MPAAGNAAGRSRRATKRAAGNGEAHQSKIQDFFQQNKMPRTAGAAGGGPRRAGKDEEEDVPGVATDKNLFEDDEDAAHVQASLSQSPTQPDVAGEEVPKEEEEEAHMQESLSQTPTQPDVAGEEELKEEEEEDGARGRTFQFRDAVHGDMTTTLAANAWIKELCETGPFQRLLETKQLGACFHVFERAVHTRAEHSVGVCYLASRMLDSLTNSIKDLHTACEGSVPHGCPALTLPEPPDHKDRFCVLAAALGHDLGHGAFSHLFEHIVHEILSTSTKRWSHEAMSVAMLDRALQEVPRAGTVGELADADLRFIHECILGKDLHVMPEKFCTNSATNSVTNSATSSAKCKNVAECREARRGRGPAKEYLYDIVSNIHSGLDVDKIDYLMRDSHVLGDAHALKTRTQGLADLCEHAAVRWCVEQATADLVFRQRQNMHRFVYNAPQVKPFERVYLAIFSQAFRLHFNDKFEPCRPRGGGVAGGAGGAGGGVGIETKSFQEAVSCPRTFESLKDSIAGSVLSFVIDQMVTDLEHETQTVTDLEQAQRWRHCLDKNTAQDELVGILELPPDTKDEADILMRLPVQPTNLGSDATVCGYPCIFQGPVVINRGQGKENPIERVHFFKKNCRGEDMWKGRAGLNPKPKPSKPNAHTFTGHLQQEGWVGGGGDVCEERFVFVYCKKQEGEGEGEGEEGREEDRVKGLRGERRREGENEKRFQALQGVLPGLRSLEEHEARSRVQAPRLNPN